jgi:hypothetical protein
MQSAEPVQPATGWKPTASTIAGGGIGGSIAYLIIRVVDHFFHTPFDPVDYIVLTTICTTVIGYFFPDGGRK